MTEGSQASPKTFPAGPGVRVLRREEAASWIDGYRFLDQAREAHALEYARGFEEGKAAGIASASSLAAETAIKIDHYVQSLETAIAGLAMDIVRKVLGEFDSAQLLARATAQALIEFRHEKALTVTVNPRMVPQISKALAAQATQLRLEFTYKVEGDAALAPDACVIATEFAVLDASLEAQLQALSKALKAAAENRSLKTS